MAAQNAREVDFIVDENGVAKDGEAKLSVKLDVDISDALTGLKAIQREAREATKALRELEEAQARSNEIDRLAAFILANYPSEPGRTGESESAVDVAIRLLGGDGD